VFLIVIRLESVLQFSHNTSEISNSGYTKKGVVLTVNNSSIQAVQQLIHFHTDRYI